MKNTSVYKSPRWTDKIEKWANENELDVFIDRDFHDDAITVTIQKQVTETTAVRTRTVEHKGGYLCHVFMDYTGFLGNEADIMAIHKSLRTTEEVINFIRRSINTANKVHEVLEQLKMELEE